MKFSIAIVGALATLGLAKPAITNTEFELTEGKPYTLEWISANGPVLVELVSGPDSLHLLPVRTLARMSALCRRQHGPRSTAHADQFA